MFAMTTPQQPLGSGFSAAATTAHILRGIDLVGHVAIVTGGYSGIGVETVRALLSAGARVIVPARDVDRASACLATMGGVEIWPMDLLDPASIDAFAKRFLDTGLPLDILVNSAGIMAVPTLERDARGHELQFATNHLGHFRLVQRLLPALRAAGKARVVSVSSFGHRYSPVHFDDLDYTRRAYDPWLGYGQSKTANILLAVELDARERANGIRAFALHPGSIAGTGLEKHIPRQMLIDHGVLDAAGNPIRDPARNLKSVEQGAATSLWCAVSPQLDGMGGVYCENCEIAKVSEAGSVETTMADSLRPGGVRGYAIDPEAARRLWALSEELTEA
jgi:NAD(P)-dependent dehydrogenase (short-subunit alcohol dehydrogenase family)